MSFTDNINGIPAQDTVLRQGIATLRNTVISNTIKPLTVDHNGVYTANPNNGTYGYSPVTVDTGVYTGATAPDNSLGKDGDYYYKITDLKTSITFNPNATQNSSTYRLGHAFYVDEPTMVYGFSGYYRHANDNIKFLLLDDQANIIYESTTMTSAANKWNSLVIDAPISIEANKMYWVMMDMPINYGCYVSFRSSNVWSNFNNIHIEKGVYYQSNSYSYDSDNIYMATILVKESYYTISNEYVKNNNAWIMLSSTDKITTTTLSATENGTYNAPTGTAYSSVSVNVGPEIISRSDWNALTPAQKQAKGLIVIQDSSSGFLRGEYVNGADYKELTIVTSGTGNSSVSLTISDPEVYCLFVIALNSKAATYDLAISVTSDGTAVSGTTVDYNEYANTGDNRRNYRINKYILDIQNESVINIALSDQGGYAALTYVLMKVDDNTFDKAISATDASASGSNDEDGFTIYGTFDGLNHSGTINISRYTANDTITTASPDVNYKSAYIFWFTFDDVN